MIILKLGGSVITDKSNRETLDRVAIEQASGAIAEASEAVILVHGGGSFGHPVADDYDVSTTHGTTDPAAIVSIHRRMTELNESIIDALQQRDVPALPLRPLSMGSRDRNGEFRLPTTVVEVMLEEGFLPVIHGDVITHEGTGATIVSGDELVIELASTHPVDRIGFCTSVPGILNDQGEIIEELDPDAAFEGVIGESDATDVTGGMAEKVRLIHEAGLPACIFGIDGLRSFLSGDRAGTLIR